MLKNCREEDFYKIHTATFSRLNPETISGFLFASMIISGIMTLVITNALTSPFITSPIWDRVYAVYLIILGIQIVTAVLYLFRSTIYKYQRMQAILLSLFCVMLSVEFYPIYFLSIEDRFAPGFFNTIGLVFLIGGFLSLLFFSIRAAVWVRQGKLRKEGPGLFHTKEFFIYLSVVGALAFLLLAWAFYQARTDYFMSIGEIITLFQAAFYSVILQYSLAMALPEIFLLTYCKFRFASYRDPNPPIRKKRPVKQKMEAKKFGYHQVSYSFYR
ncbi:hypothetical protein ACLM5H_10885 [Fredinandcohnia humi]